jgi:hypothetical protein
MKIPFQPDVIPIRQIPYRLNLVYKHKVNVDFDKMLEASIIEPVE